MSNKRKAKVLVDSDEVGCGGTISEKHTISCRFGDFAHLPHKRGDYTLSRVLKCHGYEWQILLYPGGDDDSDENNVNISVDIGLWSKVTDDLRMKYCIRAGPKKRGYVNSFKHGKTWGYGDFALRSHVLDKTKGYLDDEGTLAIEVDIQIYMKERPVFKPKKKLHLDMLKLLESPDNSDVVFLVGETKFQVHSHIIKCRAPTLASMAEDADGAEVVISNVDSQVFRQLLRHIYGDELPNASDMHRDARALLEAADRFGCSDMKLHVEAEVVQSVLSTDNAADWVLFADSHSCALLKEAAISVFKRNSETVMNSSGWAAVAESADILKELMQALVRNQSAVEGEEDDVKKMSVSTLRKNLEDEGLDVDGTREMLVERLERASRNS